MCLDLMISVNSHLIHIQLQREKTVVRCSFSQCHDELLFLFLFFLYCLFLSDVYIVKDIICIKNTQCYRMKYIYIRLFFFLFYYKMYLAHLQWKVFYHVLAVFYFIVAKRLFFFKSKDVDIKEYCYYYFSQNFIYVAFFPH